MTDDVLLVFAETISHLMVAREKLTGHGSRSYDELIALAIRKVDEVAPVNVSGAAHAKARELGLEKDLRQYCWFCQPQKRGMKDNGRTIFHWEHYTTVDEMAREVHLLGENPTPHDVLTVLRRAKIVWILKSENVELDKSGVRSRRMDPVAAYKDARIELMHDWDDCRRIPCEWHG
ncbi:hypothetical protein [Sorangium sp. So ce117]|uniref:hypothetical protein n=1 Tax=Sorangium sp. So ce117 TaxID=3133277 RepID=UPI003F619524